MEGILLPEYGIECNCCRSDCAASVSSCSTREVAFILTGETPLVKVNETFAL
jgi:hypothetical protein